MKKNNTDFFEKNYFLSFNTKRVDAPERGVSSNEAAARLSEVKELLIACQDALRYEDSWDAKDFQMLITKALILTEKK